MQNATATKTARQDTHNTQRPAARKRNTAKPRLDAMITELRNEIQKFTPEMEGLRQHTKALAPKIADAFSLFMRVHPEGTKLTFIKLFATEEQLKAFPQTDREAKAANSPVKSLFNSVDYLIREARRMDNMDSGHGRKRKKVAAANGRSTEEQVADLVYQGWYADLDNFATFAKYTGQLLSLKFADTTIQTILKAVSERLQKEQTQPQQVPTAAATPAAIPVVERAVVEPAEVSMPLPFTPSKPQVQHAA